MVIIFSKKVKSQNIFWPGYFFTFFEKMITIINKKGQKSKYFLIETANDTKFPSHLENKEAYEEEYIYNTEDETESSVHNRARPKRKCIKSRYQCERRRAF